MKTRGVFAIMAAFVAVTIGKAKDIFRISPHHGASNRASNGRDAFLSVSKPKCHTQKPRMR